MIENKVGPERPLSERGGGLLDFLQNGVEELGEGVMGRGQLYLSFPTVVIRKINFWLFSTIFGYFL